MKTVKKALVIVLSLAILLAFTAVCFADTYTISTQVAGHTYQVFQILTGEMNNGQLEKAQWGSSAKKTGSVEAADVNAISNAASLSTDKEKLAVVTEYVDFAKPIDTGTDDNEITAGNEITVPEGYYLVRDVADSQTGKDDAYTTYILRVAGNIEITPKSAKPTMDLQIWDEISDAEEGNTNGWGESADHSINESYQYKMVATLPTNDDLDSYENYTLKFTNTLAEGIVFESIDSVEFTVNSNGEEVLYTATATEGTTGEWTFTVENAKDYVTDLKGAELTVIFNAHMTEEAKIGNDDDNTDKAYLEYSNNPNEGFESDLGKTAEDTVWVFTYVMENTKIDGNTKEALAGAEFKLFKFEGENEIALIYDDTLAAYRPVKSGETAENLVSATDTGKFDIKGLDADTYILKEITAPDGYNPCEDIKVVIGAEHKESDDESSAGTVITLSQDGKDADAILVANFNGIVLPSTGGMGTTLIYIVGSVLVLGAVIVLIVKRRMQLARE